MNFELLCSQIQGLVSRDPGQRGCGALVVPGDLAAAATALAAARRVLVATGFPQAGGEAETDGPPGAIALAGALVALGKPVLLVAEAQIVPVLAAGALALGARLPAAPYGSPAAAAFGPDLLVSIERPGRAADGEYHNMRGERITARVAPVDELFLGPLPSVAVGDGGNEIGMGKVYSRIAGAVRHGERVACVVPCSHLIAAGVSNWGAWGLVTALGARTGRRLLHGPAAEAALMSAIVAAGAIDGVTGRPEPTVDGLPLAEHLRLLEELHALQLPLAAGS